jgi:DNA-binding MarR family transcriptional regulator
MNNDPWARLDALISATIEPKGPEWFTAAEMRKRYGLKRTAIQLRIKRMEERGAIERWTGGGNKVKYRLI